MLPTDAVVRRWEGWKNPWDREYRKRGRLWRGTARIDPLPLLAPPPGPVAEIGCGDGKFVAALGAAGYRTVAVDFSRWALRLIPAEPPAAACQGDARRIPLRDGAFPVVAARYLLGALRGRDRPLAAEELARILAPGGLLIVEEFTPADFRFGTGAEVEPNTFERNQGITTHYFEEQELRALFESLHVVETEHLQHGLRIMGLQRPRAAIRLALRRAPQTGVENSSSGTGA